MIQLTKEPSQQPRPIIVAASADAFTRRLADQLTPPRYEVAWSDSGGGALQLARASAPDLILIATALPDTTGLDLCRALFASRRIPGSLPVLLVAPEAPDLEHRLAALRAGARGHVGPWLDFDECRSTCEALIEAKEHADRTAAECMVDYGTGLYSRQGLVRRAREMGAEAVRQHQSLACVVFSVEVGTESREAQIAASVVRCAEELRWSGRLSDAIGRLGPKEFAVVAPATDAAGAVRLARRLAAKIRQTLGQVNLPPMPVAVRAGYDAVPNLSYAPIDPVVLLLRATTALHSGRSETGADWIRRFEDDRSAAQH